MNRRDFAITLAATPLMAQFARAATEVVAGKDYIELPTPMPVAVPGKTEVIEFFGYWCPHCNELEPKLEPWVKALPANVHFRRIPVAWQDGQIPYQKLFYALEAMGVGNEVHAKVFKAIHEQHLPLGNDAATATFATAIGVDKAKLLDAMKGFSVSLKLGPANQSAKSYQIEGVPTLVVNGRYETSPEMAKGDVQALRVVDALIQKVKTQR
jgi:protein dithiol oxidoreductase (disulfide-forming)